jgi:hypothetical protein
MVYRCEGNLRSDLVAEVIEHVTVEVLGIVDCDLLWDTESASRPLVDFGVLNDNLIK